MLIESDLKYVKQLISLWNRVFGDEEGYIKLFFNTVYQKSKTFASFDGEKIISVFYLLDCKIRFESHEYKGFYLYAAATDPDYRNRGLMGELIEQAKQYCEDKGVSFISLVPGNEPLYGYYSKFGFMTAMHKNIAVADEKLVLSHNFKIAEAKAYHRIRSAYKDNCFVWDRDELSYVFDCFNYCGIHAYIDDKCCFVADTNNHKVKELICVEADISDKLNGLSAFFGGKSFTFETPYNIGERIPFGMICPIDPKLKREWDVNDIYMNFALD